MSDYILTAVEDLEPGDVIEELGTVEDTVLNSRDYPYNDEIIVKGNFQIGSGIFTQILYDKGTELSVLDQAAASERLSCGCLFDAPHDCGSHSSDFESQADLDDYISDIEDYED